MEIQERMIGIHRIFLLWIGAFFLFFPTVSVYAQMPALISDQFSNNSQGWSVGKETDSDIRIENGKLTIRNYCPEGIVLTLKRFIDTELDFILRADIRLHPSTSTKGAGLVWGHSRSTLNDNHFLINGQGDFIINTSHKSRKGTGVITPSNAIKKDGFNTLTISQKSGILYFFINHVLVKTIPSLPWFEKSVGILVYANEEVEVDNFNLHSSGAFPVVTASPTGVVRENLGVHVNSRYEDIKPVVTADGRSLYFARKVSPFNVGGSKDRQDIWFSTSQDGLNWTPSKNMGKQINTAQADNLCAVSTDNNTMVFHVDLGNNKGSFGIRNRTINGWSNPVTLPMEFINESDYLESCLSADGNAILFTAKNKSNVAYQRDIDERDIYVAVKQKNGWSKPINLGPVINTQGDEFSPFLAADGKTLYFATDGRPGYGDVDIFMSKKTSEGWTSWSEPVNLGPEINTPDFDAYYTVPASGNFAYMVSYHNTLGKSDIIRVRLPEKIKPEPVVLIHGKTLDAKSGKPLSTQIIMEDLTGRSAAASAISDPQTGEYKLIVTHSAQYRISASASGYLSASEVYQVPDYRLYKELNKDLFLSPLLPGQSLDLQNIFFEQGKSVLRSESFPELNRLVQVMQENQEFGIEIHGYTDNVGTPSALVTLSIERVNRVKEYLVQKGIAGKRITGKGFGADNPVATNDCEENRKKNRRVEIIVRNGTFN